MDWGPGIQSAGSPATPQLAQYFFRMLPGQQTTLISTSSVKHFFAPSILDPTGTDAYSSGLNASPGLFTYGSELNPVTGELYRPSDIGDIDVNGINQLAGERYHVLYNNVYGIRTSVLRLTNTYGPRMLVKNNRQTAIGWLIRQVLDGETITIFGDGLQLRDFTFVDDAVEAFLMAGANDAANGQVFNVGATEPVSLRELAELLIDVAGSGRYELVPFPPERKAIDIGSIYVDDRKIRRVLKWRPRVDMREGLTRTIEYYREHRSQYWLPSVERATA